jgi:uncharacterized protein YodC (DUF2158 family)
MKTKQWILLVVLSIALGCSPSVPKDPESPPTYSQGDIVYHKLGGECIIVGASYGDKWQVRYIDGMGQYQHDSFHEAELSFEPPIPKVGLEE